MTKTIFTLFALLATTINISYGQTKYQNEKYGFNVQFPDDWQVYDDIKEDTITHRAIIDWGLPKVYSEIEKTSIENAVTITAYNRSDIKNLEDLEKFEFKRTEKILRSKELIEVKPYQSYIVISNINGLPYKSKVAFAFMHNIGYVLTFTATLGTYEMNLPKFDSFINGINFFEPSEEKQLDDNSKVLVYLEDKVISLIEMEALNPNDIESVEVIKDRDKIKVYTSDDYDGVIIIHMKK